MPLPDPVHLYQKIHARQHTWPDKQSNPEDNIAQQMSSFQQPCPAETDQRNLQQLHREQIAPNLVEQASHDQLVHQGRQQKCHKSRR